MAGAKLDRCLGRMAKMDVTVIEREACHALRQDMSCRNVMTLTLPEPRTPPVSHPSVAQVPLEASTVQIGTVELGESIPSVPFC